MKKTFFAALAAMIAFTFAFTSCDKEVEPKPEPTKKELLTQKNGWILAAATSEPGYEMANGERLKDLFKGYVREWEMDDVYFYDATGVFRVEPGAKLPPEDEDGWRTATTIGMWKLLDNNTKLITKLPFFYDIDENYLYVMDTVTLLELTENVLKYEFTFKLEEKKKGIKSDEVYTFTLTFHKK